MVNRVWDNTDRQYAASHYAVTGNLTKTSQATGIPLTTILGWRDGVGDSDGVFIKQLESTRSEITTEFVGQYESIVRRSLEALNEKLENGADLSARDLIVVAGVATDKSLVLAGKPNRVTSTTGVQELAAMFTKLSAQHSAKLIDHKPAQETDSKEIE